MTDLPRELGGFSWIVGVRSRGDRSKTPKNRPHRPPDAAQGRANALVSGSP
jgi:hypothetical protein